MSLHGHKRPRGLLPHRSAFLLILALAAAGGGWFFLHQRGASRAADTTAVEPAERALREAVLKNPEDIEARRAVGQYLLARRRPYEAMWAYQDALELRPGDAEARRGLARALIIAQLPRRGLEVLADRPSGSGPGAGASLSGGSEVFAAGVPEGQPNLAQAFMPGEQEPDRPSPVGTAERSRRLLTPHVDREEALEDRRVAAAAYLTFGDPMGAVTMLEAVGPALETSPAALLDLGNAYEALGDDTSAGGAYQRLVRLQPDHLEGQLALARVALRHRSWGVLFPALAQAQKAAPADPRPRYQLAQALQSRGGAEANSEGPGGAISLYHQLILSHPDFGPAHLQLGLWYLKQGRASMAAASLEKALAARAGGDDTRLRLAVALAAAGKKAEAALQRGRYYEVIQQPQRAIQEYERLAALAPARKDLPFLLSAVYSQMEQDERAVQVARRGLERDPDNLPLRTRYAMLLMLTDARSQAASLCQRWMKERPAWAEPYHLLGRMERQSLHPAEAIRLLEQALARDPHNADYCLESARALIALPTPAHLQQAAARLRQAIALDPTNAEAHLRLGEALERLGDLEGARLEYLRSMDRERSIRYGAYSLSQLCPRLKKTDRTRFYAENVRVLREREDLSKALWRQVHHSSTDAEAHAQLAELFLQAGDNRQALYQLQQAVHLHPDRQHEHQLQILRRLQSMREG